jgi:hypothetical protein
MLPDECRALQQDIWKTDANSIRATENHRNSRHTYRELFFLRLRGLALVAKCQLAILTQQSAIIQRTFLSNQNALLKISQVNNKHYLAENWLLITLCTSSKQLPAKDVMASQLLSIAVCKNHCSAARCGFLNPRN